MADEETPQVPAKNQQPLVTFLIFIIVIGLLALAFFFGLKFRATSPQEATPTPTPTPTVKVESTITPIPTIDESEAIKEAVFNKTGLNANQAEISINKNTGQHATGNIKEFEAVGGAYWLAAKTDEGWVCVYDGQSQPTCKQIAPYNFPKDMVPECLDENGKVIER